MSDAHELADYREDLGPFCDGCGQEIDPETCHCGSEIGDYWHDNHGPVPMGCLCLYDRMDWAVVAKGLRTRLRAEREAAAREIARLRAGAKDRREQVAEHPRGANQRAFEEAWSLMEARGYRYGGDALENVRFGYDLALSVMREETS